MNSLLVNYTSLDNIRHNSTQHETITLDFETCYRIYFVLTREITYMITQVQKWGNSQGVRLSKELLSNVDIDVGDSVEVSAREGELVVKPVKRIRGKYKIEDLVKQIPEDYKPEELDWGQPSGKEVW